MSIIIWSSIIVYLFIGCVLYKNLIDQIKDCDSISQESKDIYFFAAKHLPLFWMSKMLKWVLIWPWHMRKIMWCHIMIIKNRLVWPILQAKFIWWPIRFIIGSIFCSKEIKQAIEDYEAQEGV